MACCSSSPGPPEAADKALEYLRNKQKLRQATGKPSTLVPGAGLPPPTPGLGPGASLGAPNPNILPTGQVVVKQSAASVEPSLRQKLVIYAAQINKNPQLRQSMREDILRTYGVDPDLYLEPGQ